jgi:hypothetical protein
MTETSQYAGTRVISTIPLAVTAHACGIAVRTPPETVSLLSLFYRVTPSRQVATTLYNLSAEASWKRLTMISDFYEPPDSAASYCTVEVTTPSDTSLDLEDVDRAFSRHVKRLGIFEDVELVGSHMTPRAYPVFRRSSMAATEALRKEVARTGIELGGRQGLHWYAHSSEIARDATRYEAV